MEWLYYIVIPIVSALIGGVFSFICIFITIKHENRVLREERAEREKDRETQKQEKNKEKNDAIIQNRPQFIIVDDVEQADQTMAIKLLPQDDYKIRALSEDPEAELVIFNYPREIYDNNFWDSYSVTIKNVGNLVMGGFLHLPDKSWVNVYHELVFKGYPLVNFYSERVGIPAIKKNETLKITIFYPKSKLSQERMRYKRVMMDIFMYDQFENYWKQEDVIHEYTVNESYPISHREYGMNYREELVYWQVLRRLYDHKWNNKIKMKIDNFIARALFNKKNIQYEDAAKEFEQFTKDVKIGKVLLKS